MNQNYTAKCISLLQCTICVLYRATSSLEQRYHYELSFMVAIDLTKKYQGKYQREKKLKKNLKKKKC